MTEIKQTPMAEKYSFKNKVLLPSIRSPRKAIARLIMGRKIWNECVFMHTCLSFKNPNSTTEFLMSQRENSTHEHCTTFNILNHILGLKKIVEIGVYNGNSTIPLLEYAVKNNGFVTSIDVDECNEARQRIKKLGLDTHWKFIQSNSLKVDWNGQIDHLFVDGLHTFEQVTRELEKFEPFVKEYGIITIHDIAFPQVRDAVLDYIKNKSNLKYFEYYNCYGLGVIYKKKGQK